MEKILLHIPHSSTDIPIMDGYVISGVELESEALKLIDWHTEDLFQHEEAAQIIAPFSRIFCDVERFSDDKDEVMANVGMGMAYTHFDDGRILRKVDEELKDIIYHQYYLNHHTAFLEKVEEQIQKSGRCRIIDCHSFSNVPFIRDRDQSQPRPDIDIGTDSFHTPEDLRDIAHEYFKNAGFSCKVNSPYAGAMVPQKFYRKDKRVQSIMIEVNRDLYLERGTNVKSNNYEAMKKVLNRFVGHLINA